MKEEDKKEGLLKRLKNIEKNQNSNDNEKNKKTNDISKPSSDGSESSKKTSIIEYELERSVYSPDVANILEPKNETQTSFEYLEPKNETQTSFEYLKKT